ncbi:uncharacterized protein LOC107362530 [Tetranychus urticae]|uniref:Uncharacterized protein n=1 Tax=Tetranychus urticae TaxID=32264 RepID=T1KBI0_TETUR|nr:uncharacterized protein LOC107362530 [Tetranychus urticae]
MPYHIWDTPDHKDLDKKLWAVTKLAVGYSTASTIYQSFANFLPASARAFMLIYAKSLIPNVVAVNVGMTTAYLTAKIRGDVDNHWNYLPGALAFAGTATLLRFNSTWSPGPRFGIHLVLALPLIIAKYGHMERRGGNFPRIWIGSEQAADAFGGVRNKVPLEYMPQDWGRRQ